MKFFHFARFALITLFIAALGMACVKKSGEPDFGLGGQGEDAGSTNQDRLAAQEEEELFIILGDALYLKE